jgi:AraC-like DNA-binding protein
MLKDNSLWRGFHIGRWRCAAGQVEESVAGTHIISVTLANESNAESHMTTRFRRVTGYSPGDYRVRNTSEQRDIIS